MTGFTLLLALASLTTQAGKSVGPEASLRRGQYLRAIQLFNQQIKRDPSDESARIGLGRAQIALGRCEQGRNSLSGLRQSPHWSALSATAEGTCALRAGNASLAITAFEEAVLMDPNHGRGWYGLFRAQVLGGDLTAAAVSLTKLDEDSQTTDLFPTAELTLDWATTAVDVDTRLHGMLTWEEDSPAPMASRLALVSSAERWLDLGDPQSAKTELLGIHHRYPGNVQYAQTGNMVH
jgi:tetratricopeptide (TPR) repeat protein